MTRIVAPGLTVSPACRSRCSSTITSPARMSRRARSRLGASPRATIARSSRSSDDTSHELAQRRGAAPEALERTIRAPPGAPHGRPGTVEAEQRRIRGLAARRVPARALAGRLRASDLVEDVVGDLERETERLAVGRE